MSRTNPIWTRFYVDGLDISGVARDAGMFGVEIDAQQDRALSDAVFNVSLGRGVIKCGPVNAFLSPAAAPTGFHELVSVGSGRRAVMRAQGVGAEPTVGDPCAAWIFEQGGYEVVPAPGFVGVNMPLLNSARTSPLNYLNPFGYLLHGKTAETAANTAVATLDNGAESTYGGFFAYQLISSNGTVTLSVDDSATNANNAAFAALSGATSGIVDASSTPVGGCVPLGVTATVRRYLRWQIALGTATTCTFLAAFMRGNS